MHVLHDGPAHHVPQHVIAGRAISCRRVGAGIPRKFVARWNAKSTAEEAEWLVPWDMFPSTAFWSSFSFMFDSAFR